MNASYRVSDLDAARAFYLGTLGFQELYRDEEERWACLVRSGLQLVVGERVPDAGEDGPVFSMDAEDLKGEADRLRRAGVEVGVVVEIPGTIRLLDVFDPDGNRLQLSEPV